MPVSATTQAVVALVLICVDPKFTSASLARPCFE
jgi:hypothetical protein